MSKVINISEVLYRCVEFEGGVYLQSKFKEIDMDFVDVEDLTELKIWEYNRLVREIEIYFPDYPIECLEGRFV